MNKILGEKQADSWNLVHTKILDLWFAKFCPSKKFIHLEYDHKGNFLGWKMYKTKKNFEHEWI